MRNKFKHSDKFGGRRERDEDHNGDGHHDHGRGWFHARHRHDDDHPGRGHIRGDHNGDGRPDNGNCGNVTPPPPPPPPPPAASINLATSNVADASTSDNRTGTDAADMMMGGAGNDTLTGGLGNDVLTGDGVGSVTVALDIAASLSNAANPAAVSIVVTGVPQGASLSAGSVNADGSWTLSAADLAGLTLTSSDNGDFTLHVVATATDGSGLTAASDIAITLAGGNTDVLDGGEGNDYLDGGVGDDRMIDGAGNDTALGGAGNDTFVAGDGDDVYQGDEGFDTIDFSGGSAFGSDGMYVNLETGIISGAGNGTGDDSISGIEGIVGSNGADLVFGNAAANMIDAGDGDDVLVGGRGADTLTGGDGTDTFIIRFDDSVSSQGVSFGTDTITDFQVGDTLMVSGLQNLSLSDDGQSSTLHATVNGQTVDVAVLAGFTGLTLEQMSDFGLLVY